MLFEFNDVSDRDFASGLKSFEVSGTWWLPGHDDAAVAGTLKFSPNTGVTLALHGAPHDLAFFTDEPNVPVLHGRTLGSVVTLLNGFYTGWKGASLFEPNVRESNLRFRYLLAGRHLMAENCQPFQSMTVRYSNSELWFGQAVLPRTKNGGVEYSEPKEYTIAISDDWTLGTSSSLTLTGGQLHRTELDHHRLFTLHSHQPSLLTDFTNQLHHLSQFLMLCQGVDVLPTSIRLSLPTPDDQDAYKPREEVGLFLHLGDRTVPDVGAPMNFTVWFPKIEQHFVQAAEAWFAKAEIQKFCRNLFFSEISHEAAFAESRFLSIVQAVEAYCHTTQQGLYCDQATYESVAVTLRAAIPRSLTRDHRKALESRIQYGNQHSLRKRIRDLLHSLEPDTQRVLCNKVSDFCNGVVNTRNHFTHWTSETSQFALKGTALYWATYKLRKLLTFVFLVEAGIPEPDARVLVQDEGRAKVWRTFPE